VKERIEAQLRRIRDLYEWGDLGRQEYSKKKDALDQQLREIAAAQPDDDRLRRLASFLADIVKAWDAATEEQRNKLARCLFEEIWLNGKSIVAVRPVSEFEPFFRLNYEDFVRKDNEVATPRGFGFPRATLEVALLQVVETKKGFEFGQRLNAGDAIVFYPDLLEEGASEPIPLALISHIPSRRNVCEELGQLFQSVRLGVDWA
jgi:hypothetical protein